MSAYAKRLKTEHIHAVKQHYIMTLEEIHYLRSNQESIFDEIKALEDLKEIKMEVMRRYPEHSERIFDTWRREANIPQPKQAINRKNSTRRNEGK